MAQDSWTARHSYYHATERNPLLGGPHGTSSSASSSCSKTAIDSESDDKQSVLPFSIKTVLLVTLGLICLCSLLGVLVDRGFESGVRARTRKAWDLEVQGWIDHVSQRQVKERRRMEKIEREEHELIVRRDQAKDDCKLEERKFISRREELEANFKHEERDLAEKRDHMNRDYMQEERDLIEKRDHMLGSYKLEEDALIKRRDEMNRAYMREAAVLRRRIEGFEEELERKAEQEKQERERAQVHWVDIQGAEHCLSNGRKKYSARLANLPASLDAMEACRATSVTINGIAYESPMSCEDRGRSDGVYGHWIIDNEGVCASYWESVKLKDCTAPKSGFRRIEAKLGVVHAGEDAEALCLTTHLSIYGLTYERPMACPNWSMYGYWGIWDVPDDKCR
ncbi:hypothetical protein FPV67DRAFT_1484914 [Lyophyllum atratum]|nr:hypothetical protein FPV67DRAFT_1484914 [Lyophyllum atratum]